MEGCQQKWCWCQRCNVPKILKLLNWLESYFVERDTSTNFENNNNNNITFILMKEVLQSHTSRSVELHEGDDDEEINDDFDNCSVGSEDSFMSVIVTKPNESSQQKKM